jgi:DNA uptake protein ComE-like DNA-binding protein
MRRIPLLRMSCFVLVLFLVACTQEQRTDQLRERTADATAALKRDAKAVAQGIHEGWTRENPLNVNSATREQLQQLPGIDQARADHIIARRPYRQPADLVTRKVLSQAEYDKIKDRVKVK